MENLIQKILIDLIDDPKIAMRSNVDDDELDELMASMREHGLIQPVSVRPVGLRYEVIAGHRRTRAARLLGWTFLDCVVKNVDEHEGEILKMHENLLRRDVDPVDEACFIGEIMHKKNYSVPQLARMINRSDQYIRDRLDVFDMPDFLQNYLQQKRISLGAALWINRIGNADTKKYYANWAALNGVSVNGAKKWHDDLAAVNFEFSAQNVEIRDEGTGEQRLRTVTHCACCGKDVFLDEADNVFVHRNFGCPV